MTLLAVKGLGIGFGGIRAVDNVTFSTEPGKIFSIIGPNGAGKTTLFNLISGVYRTESGSVTLLGEEVTRLSPEALAARGMARTFQNLQVFFRMSALDNVMVGAHVHEKPGGFSHLLGLPSTARENRQTRDEAMVLLARLRLADVAERTAGNLSYGQLKRLEIARALASRPKILLLDEPVAGMTDEETARTAELFLSLKGKHSLMVVEHDMSFIRTISDIVTVLCDGSVLAQGTLDQVQADERVIEVYLGR